MISRRIFVTLSIKVSFGRARERESWLVNQCARTYKWVTAIVRMMMMRGGGVEVATAAGVNYNNYNFFITPVCVHLVWMMLMTSVWLTRRSKLLESRCVETNKEEFLLYPHYCL